MKLAEKLGCSLILLGSLLPNLAGQDSIPLPKLRACAEFEPALGTLITYPTNLPLETLAVELAEDDLLYVLVDHTKNKAKAFFGLMAVGVNMRNVKFIMAPTADIYTRDFGAPQAFLGSSRHGYVDPIFWDYAYQAGNGGRVFAPGPGAFLNDDVTPAAVAAHLGVEHVEFPAHLVGGNIDFDGLGKAFCTQVLVDENEHWGIAETRFRALMKRYLGVGDLIVVPNFEVFGIQHVDCVLKVLDEETLLITRVPATHPSFLFHEAVALAAAAAKTAYGRPYVIHRVDTPVFRGGVRGETANYANSLILNGKVLVPMFDLPMADANALDVYRQAMPGYEVLGFHYVQGIPLIKSWASFDALHCRTHQVFDPEMVLIKHPRVRSAAAGSSQIKIQALIKDYGGAGLLDAETKVFWRKAGDSQWHQADFQPGQHPDEYVAFLPGQPAGTGVEYYLQATTADQRQEHRPPLAPQGYFSFPVQ
ncbi:MAG: hypothetical protein DWQ01_17450 [Planctomycetota bacterium]|nr:MAG: hypothetical protein DWQ01_17450 [Planctomycetota bacterium]